MNENNTSSYKVCSVETVYIESLYWKLLFSFATGNTHVQWTFSRQNCFFILMLVTIRLPLTGDTWNKLLHFLLLFSYPTLIFLDGKYHVHAGCGCYKSFNARHIQSGHHWKLTVYIVFPIPFSAANVVYGNSSSNWMKTMFTVDKSSPNNCLLLWKKKKRKQGFH